MSLPEIGLTPSEQFVVQLCLRSFLRLWTHPNPKGKKEKELCDCLIVCDRHIVIISVKDCAYRDTGDDTGWKRWQKKAIDESMDQIAGAQRWLATVDRVERGDGRIVDLPRHDVRQYHRIAVALGGNGEVPIQFGDQGQGFVHLCDEKSLEAVFTSLDTITDFVNFLTDTEALFAGGTRVVFSGGGIEDLLALYLGWGNQYRRPGDTGSKSPDVMVLENDLWSGLSASEGFAQRTKDLEESYAWDLLIELVTKDLLSDGMFDFETGEVTQSQLALIEMAKQPRDYRLPLAKAFNDFLSSKTSAARVAEGYGGTAFVFLAREAAERERAAGELVARCHIVRARMPGVTTVVGIGTERLGSGGRSFDLVFIDYPEFSGEILKSTLKMQDETGLFKGVTWDRRSPSAKTDLTAPS